MKTNFKLRFLCGTLALSLVMTACGSTSGQGTEVSSLEEDTQTVSVEQENTEIVGSASEGSDEAVEEEVTLTAEELEWQNCMMANVTDTLNVRASASSDAAVVGQLARGDRGTVLEIGEAWTKISSGNVTGYVSNDYCIYGLQALAFAKQICNTVATSTTDLLNVRKEMSTDSAILDQLNKGEKIVVNTAVAPQAGWVAVVYNGATAYVSADYVTVALNVGTALTMDEIYAIEAAKKAEQAKKEAEAKKDDKKSGGSGTKTTINSEVIVNATDLEVLTAMVYCEAGGESYECQLAVASVIMNRVKSWKFANSIKGVVFQKGQFPPATNGKLEKRLKSGKVSSSCLQAAQAAMAGQDNTDGCLYFNDYNGSRQGLRIGGMVFWKSW